MSGQEACFPVFHYTLNCLLVLLNWRRIRPTVAVLWIKSYGLNIAWSSFFTVGGGGRVTAPCGPIYQGVCLCFWCRSLKEKVFLKQLGYGFPEGGLEKSSISELKVKSLLSHWFLFHGKLAIHDALKQTKVQTWSKGCRERFDRQLGAVVG